MGAHAEGLACRGQLTLCIGAAVRALGPEQVLAVLPLRLEEGIDAEIQAKTEAGDDMDADEDDMDLGAVAGAELNAEGGNVAGAAGARLWLVPLLRQALRGARMSYFTEEMLPVARRLGGRAAQRKSCGSSVRGAAMRRGGGAIWSLLPAFCRWPEDAAESFSGLAPSLGSALSARADLRGPLTEALRRLIQQARAVMREDADAESDADDGEDEDEEDEDKAKEADGGRRSSRTVPTGSPPRWRRAKRPPWRNTRATSSRFSSTSSSPRPPSDAASSPPPWDASHRSPTPRPSAVFSAPSFASSSRSRRTSRTPPTRSPRAATRVPRDDARSWTSPWRWSPVLMALRATWCSKRRDRGDGEGCRRAKESVQTPRGARETQRRSVRADGATDWLANNRDAAEEALVEGSGSCAPAARRYRLRCAASILPSLMEREAAKEAEAPSDADDGAAMSAQGSFAVLLGELIVATKESNARTRQQAFKLLVDIRSRAMERARGWSPRAGRISGGAGGGGGMLGAWLAAGDDDDAIDGALGAAAGADSDDDAMDAGGDARDEMGAGVRKFFMTVLAGVVGATPTMQSAAVMALARLLYEFSAALVSTVPELLPAVFALMEGGNREAATARSVSSRWPRCDCRRRSSPRSSPRSCPRSSRRATRRMGSIVSEAKFAWWWSVW